MAGRDLSQAVPAARRRGGSGGGKSVRLGEDRIQVDGLACRDGARKRGHEEDDVRRVKDRHLDICEEGRTKECVGVPERKFSARKGGSQEGFCGKEVDEEVVGHHRLPTERHPQ